MQRSLRVPPRPALVVPVLLLVALSGCLQGNGILGGGDEGVTPPDYLRAGPYSTWHVEVDAVQGWEPDPDALALLRERMGALVHKERIVTDVDGVLPGRASWTAQDLLALREHQQARTGGDTVVTYVVYLDGEFADNPDALGVTDGHDLVAIFRQRIEAACQPTPGFDPGATDPLGAITSLPCLFAAPDIEAAVLVHEFGHAIGLVNRGVPMAEDHEDAEHERHSSNPDSVMYWAVDSNLAVGGQESLPNRFDDADRADVCAAGGRC